MAHWLLVVLLAMALLSLPLACAPTAGHPPTPTIAGVAVPEATATPASSRFPLAISDSADRRVHFQTPPRRILSLSPAHTEILFAIGVGDLVIGTDNFSDFPPSAKALPKVGYSTLDYEKIVGLAPDLVYVATRQKPFLPELEKLGLRVLYMEEPKAVAGIFEHIALLGKITDHQQEAQELIAGMKGKMQAIESKLADLEEGAGPRYYYELTPELYSVSPSSFIGDLLRRLKARNIVPQSDRPFPRLSPEFIVAADPQVIFLAEPPSAVSVAGVRSRPGWQSIAAVRETRIHFVDADLLSRPGPRIVEGMAALATLLYPERF